MSSNWMNQGLKKTNKQKNCFYDVEIFVIYYEFYFFSNTFEAWTINPKLVYLMSEENFSRLFYQTQLLEKGD